LRSYFDFTSGEFGNDFLGVLLIDGASDGETSTEDLLDGSGEVLGHGFFFDDFSDLFDLFKSKVSLVGDVFDFLSISFVVAEFLDDKG